MLWSRFRELSHSTTHPALSWCVAELSQAAEPAKTPNLQNTAPWDARGRGALLQRQRAPSPHGAAQLAQHRAGQHTAITSDPLQVTVQATAGFPPAGKFLLLSSLGNTYRCARALSAALETAQNPKKFTMVSSVPFLNNSWHWTFAAR